MGNPRLSEKTVKWMSNKRTSKENKQILLALYKDLLPTLSNTNRKAISVYYLRRIRTISLGSWRWLNMYRWGINNPHNKYGDLDRYTALTYDLMPIIKSGAWKKYKALAVKAFDRWTN